MYVNVNVFFMKSSLLNKTAISSIEIKVQNSETDFKKLVV